jgi:hypothetical protein
VTIGQLPEFDLAIPSVYSGFLSVSSLVYVRLVVGFAIFIEDLFPVVTVR